MKYVIFYLDLADFYMEMDGSAIVFAPFFR
jgi:hypothetical protein